MTVPTTDIEVQDPDGRGVGTDHKKRIGRRDIGHLRVCVERQRLRRRLDRVANLGGHQILFAVRDPIQAQDVVKSCAVEGLDQRHVQQPGQFDDVRVTWMVGE